MVRVRCAVVAAFALLSSVSQSSAQCPSYTHKDDVIAGTASALPDGWFVYSKSGSNGLFRSSIRTFGETTVTGTAADRAISMDISPDGEWIVYLNTNDNNVYLVKSSGGTRTRVPLVMFNVASLSLPWTGFYRNSPNGLEIFYPDFNWAGKSYLCAIPVNLSGATPTFGTARIILESQRPNDPAWQYTMWIQQGTCSVYGDQIFGLFSRESSRLLNGFVTIPDNGAGIATYSNVYQFSEPIAINYYGCGQTMSHDGLYCASNSASVGSSCVPNKKNNPEMDHKGIYITKFLRQGRDPAITIDAQIDNPSYGRSINWCPVNYRVGTYAEVEFMDWNFSNDNEYLAGVSRGTGIAANGLSFGIWALHWSTNAWTLLTPSTTTVSYQEPAVFFPGAAGVESRSIKTQRTMNAAPRVQALDGFVTLEPGTTKYSIWDANGRLVLSRNVTSESGSRIALPRSLQNGTFIVTQQ